MDDDAPVDPPAPSLDAGGSPPEEPTAAEDDETVAEPGDEPVEVAGDAPRIVPDGLVELALAQVDLSPDGLQPATGTVSLVEMVGGSRLDIVMARTDAVLVQEAIAGVAPPRPRAHDLLLAAVAALGGSVVGVTLTERRPGGVYVAELRLRLADGAEVGLDARPSDAVNVVLRTVGASVWARAELVGVPAN